MKRLVARAAFVGISTLAAAASAHAGGNVYWSIGINAPLDPYGASIGTTISNAPRYYQAPAPVYVQPAPIYYERPAPIYYERPAPIYYAPAPIYYSPPVRVRPYPYYIAEPRWSPPGHGHWKHRGHDRDDRNDDHDRRDRWDRQYGPRM